VDETASPMNFQLPSWPRLSLNTSSRRAHTSRIGRPWIDSSLSLSLHLTAGFALYRAKKPRSGHVRQTLRTKSHPPSEPVLNHRAGRVPLCQSHCASGDSSTRYSSLHSADPVAQVRFLATLNLRTIISLTPEHPIKPFLTFTRAAGIHFVRHPPESPLQQVLTRAAALRGDILAPVDGLATDPGRSGQGDPRMSTGRPESPYPPDRPVSPSPSYSFEQDSID